MAFVGKLTACVLVLVFAAGASAATCDDGSSVGSNGCCAATNECPPCIYSEAESTADGTTCTCLGCAGGTATIDSTCSATGGACVNEGGTGQSMKMNGCEICVDTGGNCINSVSACSTYLQMSGLSVDSSGLISSTGAGRLSCDACCPTGTCDGPDDASKPACEACNACYNQGIPCPADWTEDSAAGGVSCPTGCVATRRARARRLLFSSLPLECGPGCEPM